MTRRTFLATLPAAGVTLGTPVAGLPGFTLGLYDLPKAADPWGEAAAAGFNLAHVDGSLAQFDQAHQHGMSGWTGLGSISPENRAADEARIRSVVEKLKNHPALLFWETEDEPAYQWKKPGPRVAPERIIAAYRFVKSLDPRHPVYLNHAPANLVSTLREYNAGADIIAADIYPVIPRGIREEYALWPDGMQGDLLDTSIGQVGRYAHKMREVAGSQRAVFMVLQAFAWENLRDRDRDPAAVLYPTRAQLRFMAWDAIVQGVNGLLFWGLAATPADAPVWPALKSVAAELHELTSALAARAEPLAVDLRHHDTGHSLDRGVQWIAKPWRGGVLLLAVNGDRYPVDVTLAVPPLFKHCAVHGEARTLAMKDGRFRDVFQPFDTHAYLLTRR